MAEVFIPLGVGVAWALVLAAALAVALVGPPGWWTVPAFWLASVAASAGIYLLHPNSDDYAFVPRAILATLVCGALAVGVSWRARPRASLWVTLPTALSGVLTPPIALFLLFLSICEWGFGGTCPS